MSYRRVGCLFYTFQEFACNFGSGSRTRKQRLLLDIGPPQAHQNAVSIDNSKPSLLDRIGHTCEPLADQATKSQAKFFHSYLTQSKAMEKHLLSCPITGSILREPVVASDGNTYERESLDLLLKSTPIPRSPISGEMLNTGVIIPNSAIQTILGRAEGSVEKAEKTRPVISTMTPPVLVSAENQVNCRISSNLQDLDIMHEKYGWIPNSMQIRPSTETLLRKSKYFAEIITQYATERDFLLHTIFDMPAKATAAEKLEVVHPPHFVLRPHSLRRTKPNMFPYDVPDKTLHFVHWIYPHFGMIEVSDGKLVLLDENETNKTIKNQLQYYFGPRTHFEFVWDVNPKMSLPHEKTGILHVHVFARIVNTD